MDGFGRIEVKTLADRAYDRIEAAIMRGELRAGARVSDFALARKLGISRGPIREAIQRLEGRKLVCRVPHVGATVVAPSWEDLIEIFMVREALEGMACRLAAERMMPEEITELERLLDRHHGTPEVRNGVAYYQAAGDLDFHYRLARGSGNRRLISLLCDDLYYALRVFRYQAGATPGRARQALEEHHAVVQAVRAHDPEAAERLMRAHIRRARALIEEKLRNGTPAPTPGRPKRAAR